MFDSIAHPKKRAFLAAYSECGMVTRAAELAGISRELHYDWKTQDANYAEAFAVATVLAGDALADEAARRAQFGVDDYVLYQGEVVMHNGTPIVKRKYSDGLLEMLLTGAKPELYGKKLDHTGEIKHIHTVDLTAFSDEELELLGRLAAKATQPASDRGGDRTPAAE
jgi:hypothetical protein